MSVDKDRILEQALKHELRGAAFPPAGEPALRSVGEGGCLDAETLAAWADDGLDARAMAAAETHISNCARCQSLAATLARGAGTVSTAGTPGTERTFPLWKWWLAPVAAGVTAVTLWMVIPEQQQLAVAPAQEKVSDASLMMTAPPDPAAPAPAGPPPARADAERFAGRDTSTLARENRSQPAVVAESKQETARLQERIAVADAATGVAASAAQRAEPPAAAAPPPVAALEAAPGARVGALQKSAVAAGIEVPSIQQSRKWRITTGRIERTDDGGATWSVQRQVSNEVITAGSAPAVAVAWFVGGGGLVLVTTDAGATFSDVSLAEPLDIASVSAADARIAAIFTVSGRRFRTQDGGRTWQPF